MPNFAPNQQCWSDFNSVNRSELTVVTSFRNCLKFLTIPTFTFFTPPYCTNGGKINGDIDQPNDRANIEQSSKEP